MYLYLYNIDVCVCVCVRIKYFISRYYRYIGTYNINKYIYTNGYSINIFYHEQVVIKSIF